MSMQGTTDWTVKAKVWAATAGAVVGQLLGTLTMAGFNVEGTAAHWIHGALGVAGAFGFGYAKKETH